MKTCSRCGQRKSIDEFSKNSKSADGHKSHCKECHNAAQRQYAEINVEKVKESVLKYKQHNPDKVKFWNRAWKERHPEIKSDRDKSYYQKHKEKIIDTVTKYRRVNPEKVLLWSRKHSQENREKERQRGILYRETHREKRRETQRNYAKSHPEQIRDKVKRRRATKLSVAGNFNHMLWRWLVSVCGNKCLLCNESEIPLTQDHIIPISMNGADSIENSQPLCAVCNAKKGIRAVDYRPKWLRVFLKP